MIHTELLAIAKLSGCTLFVETGTCKGASLFRAVTSGIFRTCLSCEIQESLYKAFVSRYPNNPKRQTFLGSSLDCLESDLLPRISEQDIPFFWLDAHYSEGATGGSDLPCPLLEELELIGKALTGRKAVIAIDDIDFLGHSDRAVQGHNWPTSAQVREVLKKYFSNLVEIDYYKKQKVNNGVLVLAPFTPDPQKTARLVRYYQKKEKIIFWWKHQIENPIRKKMGLPL